MIYKNISIQICHKQKPDRKLEHMLATLSRQPYVNDRVVLVIVRNNCYRMFSFLLYTPCHV